MPRSTRLDPARLREHRFEIRNPTVEERVDVFLAKRLPEYSRTLHQRFIKEGGVRVNGRAVKANHEVRKGDVVEVAIPAVLESRPVARELPLDILFEDEHLIAINKPPGRVVHPAAGHWDDTLVNAILHHCGGELPVVDDVFRPGIVHRLDKDTSGVILAAKTARAQADLAEQFRARTVRKVYRAIVEGEVAFDEDVIEKSIARHRKHFDKMAVVKAGLGKEAASRYRVLERFAAPAFRATHVEVMPVTGRTHQIRVHLAAIGHPCLADSTYGRHDCVRAGEIDAAAPDPTAILLARQALHAFRIEVAHPATGAPLAFEAPLAADLAAVLAALRGAAAGP